MHTIRAEYTQCLKKSPEISHMCLLLLHPPQHHFLQEGVSADVGDMDYLWRSCFIVGVSQVKGGGCSQPPNLTPETLSR